MDRYERGTLLSTLPPEPEVRPLRDEIRASVFAGDRRIVVLDDDPTGVQTVHDVDVLTTWDVPELSAAMERPDPLFYVLTNSRALSRAAAVRLAAEVAGNLAAAAHRTKVGVDVISRGDSTLRGHFPSEVEPLFRLLGPNGPHGVLIVPAFPEGGRVTVGGTHYVSAGGELVPVAETDFARDPSFGYTHSYMPLWVEEKTGGLWKAVDVLHVPLALLRAGDVEAVRAILQQAEKARPIVADSVGYADLIVLATALLRAEARGHRFICRTAASFVKARLALDDRPPLTRDNLGLGHSAGPGLVLLGSYVRRSSEQLASVLQRAQLDAREMVVESLLGDGRDAHLAELTAWVDDALAAGRSAMLYTSRDLVSHRGNLDHFAIAAAVSESMSQIVRTMVSKPSWLIAKGGITASDIATRGMGVRRARVLGQVATGVPVWRLGAESRFPGMPYIVFPGNVGGPDALTELIALLNSPERKAQT